MASLTDFDATQVQNVVVALLSPQNQADRLLYRIYSWFLGIYQVNEQFTPPPAELSRVYETLIGEPRLANTRVEVAALLARECANGHTLQGFIFPIENLENLALPAKNEVPERPDIQQQTSASTKTSTRKLSTAGAIVFICIGLSVWGYLSTKTMRNSEMTNAVSTTQSLTLAYGTNVNTAIADINAGNATIGRLGREVDAEPQVAQSDMWRTELKIAFINMRRGTQRIMKLTVPPRSKTAHQYLSAFAYHLEQYMALTEESLDTNDIVKYEEALKHFLAAEQQKTKWIDETGKSP